jgi:hypothetical protein
MSYIFAGRSYGKQEIYFKAAVAKDIAFLINSMYSAPGDVSFIYPMELTEFGVKIKNNKVIVFKHTPLDVTAGSYEYAGINDDTKKINIEIDNVYKIKFEKKGDIVSVSKIDKPNR